MQAILGLIEHGRLRAIHHRVGDLLAAVRRQAVHEERVLVCAVHQRTVDLVGLEDVMAARLVLLVHGYPGIGDDQIGARNGPFGIVAEHDLAAVVARPLNAIALGDDLAAALGANITRVRSVVTVAVTLLAGAATAAAGPIGFVGLMVPHVARWIVGPDQRWITAFTVVLAPILLLSADIVGRIVMRPGELQVGIVTAFVGAPVLILLARRRKVSGL